MTNTEGNNGGSWTKPVTKTIGALQGTPMLLVLVLLNAACFAMLTWLIMKSAEYRFAERTELMNTINNCISKLHERPNGIRAQKMQTPLHKPLKE